MKLLSLDLSTSCTGWAVFEIESGELLEHGLLQPKVAGSHKLKYPKKALFNILDMTEKVCQLVSNQKPDQIVIEEVNRGMNRIGQKSLDALHFFVLDGFKRADATLLDRITYIDSNGLTGWRPALGIKLSEADKAINREIRKAKKKHKAVSPAVINWKTLSVRWVTATYGLKLSTDLDPGTDGDLADAIALGTAWLKCYGKKLHKS